jgi:hypothetical protein
MTIQLPPISNFPLFNFDRLIKKLDENTRKLKSGSETRSTTFRQDIEYFRNNWIDKENACALTKTQLRSASTHLLESERTFVDLLDAELLDEMAIVLESSESVGVKRKLIELYFQYFQKLQDKNSHIEKHITRMLSNFNGRNILMNEYKANIYLLFSPAKMLEKFLSVVDIEQKFNLSPNSEYYKTLLIFQIVKEVESLYPGEAKEYLFKLVDEHKNYEYQDGLKVSEYVVRTLIGIMMNTSTNVDYAKWVTFIIDLMGDPRTISARTAHNVQWTRVGEIYKTYLVGYLSREDLALFLEALSSPEHDDIYQYRKAFWKPFSEYVRYTKLFITKHEFMNLDEKFRKRFNGSNSAYSFISDAQRSCIYMDFGEVKVIEGTHNAKVRLYSDIPIDLTKKEYEYTEFYRSNKARNCMITDFTHSYSEAGKWQEKVLVAIKAIKHIDIKLVDVIL